MKRMKRFASLILAFILAFVLAVPAFAATTNITISGGAKGAEYEAYRLLNATEGNNDNFTYTVNEKYRAALQTVTEKTTDAEIISYISGLNETDLRTFADDVYAEVKSLDADVTTTTNRFESVEQGYYLIAETKTGVDPDSFSLVMLNTAGKTDLNVTTKEDVPEVDKKVQEKNDSTGATSDWQDGADYDVNDHVPFKLTGTLPNNYDKYSTYKYVFHDEQSDGLTFEPNTVEVYVVNGDRKTMVSNSLYEVVTSDLTDGCTFEVRFEDLKKVTEDSKSKIVVEYTSILNDKSVIGSEGNPNQVKLEFSNNPYGDGTGETPYDKVIVFTYKIVANKVDKDNKPLEGAGFTLYKFDSEANDYVAVGNEIKTDADGKALTTFTFNRLDAGKYKLVETTVPATYNKAEDLIFTVEATYETDSAEPKFKDLVVKVKDANGDDISGTTFTVNTTEGSVSTNIVNHAGTELPSTGGIGTTIFYLTGTILVLGAVVLLITKKRMENAEKQD